MFCFCFLFFDDFCQTDYIKNRRIDLRQIFRVGIELYGCMVIGLKLVFLIHQGSLPLQPIFVGFIRRIEYVFMRFYSQN